jgi:hypothetical protein
MAVGALKFLIFRGEAPAGLSIGMPKSLNPTNHLRPPGGGAFPLPSVNVVLLPNALYALTPATARQSAIGTYGGYGRVLRSDVRANSPSDSGVKGAAVNDGAFVDRC